MAKRYWPGKAPSWNDEQGEKERLRKEATVLDRASVLAPRQGKTSDTRRRPVYEGQIISLGEQAPEQPPEPASHAAPDITEPVIITPNLDDEEDEVDEEILLRRERARLRAKELEAEAPASAQTEPMIPAEEDEWEEVVEEIVEEEEEVPEDARVEYIQPTFVPKEARSTTKKEPVEGDEERERKEKEKRDKERHELARHLLAHTLEKEQKEEAMEMLSLGEEEAEKDVEDGDEAEEYEAWRLRELARLKRDYDERTQYDEEKLETERRRKLTDEEIIAEDANTARFAEEDPGQRRFLQKYWHKGAFYQDEPILQRDYSAPTGEDAWVDKSILPKVLQVKNFGKKGRTKYTHLVAEDTTQWDSGWSSKKNPLLQHYERKMGGVVGLGLVHKKRKREEGQQSSTSASTARGSGGDRR